MVSEPVPVPPRPSSTITVSSQEPFAGRVAPSVNVGLFTLAAANVPAQPLSVDQV